jgi:uncharacterized protein (DUF736 family)
MATIGTFTKRGDVLVGAIQTLTLDVELEIRKVSKASDNAPDFRIYARGTAKRPNETETEVGAAWKKTSREDRDYLSLKLDDPSLPAPIFATLVEDQAVSDGSRFTLIWTRPETGRS